MDNKNKKVINEHFDLLYKFMDFTSMDNEKRDFLSLIIDHTKSNLGYYSEQKGVKTDKNAVGVRLSGLRKQNKLSMDEVAHYVNVSGRSTINGWEKGRSIPEDDKLERLSTLFNVSIDYILHGNNYKNEMLRDTLDSIYDHLKM